MTDSRVTNRATTLGPRFSAALTYAAELHGSQLRKGTSIPYVAHLLAVAATVIEYGGDEDQAIAALLHDAVEDQGGREQLERIRRRFGERVAAIVEACTDSFEQGEQKEDWRPRKEKYLAAIAGKPRDALLVSAADKLHNATAILEDYRVEVEALWARFKGGRESLWYYASLVDSLRGRTDERLHRRLAVAVEELHSLARVDSSNQLTHVAHHATVRP